MPFKEDFFDRVFCFGVLQHTPDPERAFMVIVKYLKHGGKIASDVYLKDFRRVLHVKTYVRPFSKDCEPRTLYRFTKKYVDLMWPLVKIMRKTYLCQKLISRFVADRSGYLHDVDDSLLKEWALLDTFDWFSPTYDKPQTVKTFLKWHKNAGLEKIEIHRGFNGIEGRATKPE